MNSTPNLTEKFIMGTSQDIGLTGGSNTHKLTIDELPPHQHKVFLSTSFDGDHAHNYKDVFYSEYPINNDFTHIPHGLGTKGSLDHDNVGNQFDRTSSSAGAHQHNIDGLTASTGEGVIIDKRPAYYAAFYIIYLGN